MRINRPVSRRKALAICAGVGAAAMVPPGSRSSPPALEWRGRALGGNAQILLRHEDVTLAKNLMGHCLGEIERLERIFSLYRADSEISRLNRDGRLSSASHDFRLLLSEARRYGHLSDGAFDVTVQPLWRLYSRHFRSGSAVSSAPDPTEIDHQRRLVDYRNIDLHAGHVQLAKSGMSLTLNGIAQGYITDRIAGILKDSGMTDVLVDLGEMRILEGGEWNIGIEDPRRPERTKISIPIVGGAVATSAGAGSRFEPSGRYHHLLNPQTGDCSSTCLSATAIAETATAADALATALAVSPPDKAGDLLAEFSAQRAILVLADGNVLDLTS